jgi:hypothetical protein
MFGRLGIACVAADPTHPARFFERFAGQEMLFRGGGIHSRDGITSCVTARLILARPLISDAVEIAVSLVAQLMPELAGSASPPARMMGLSGFSNGLNCATGRACPDRAV